MAHMSIQNSQIRTNDGVNGGVRDQQHQENTTETLKTEPDDHLLPILSSSGHNYAVQVRSRIIHFKLHVKVIWECFQGILLSIKT